jgi:GAF domain-containing protein/HAMP domain-containing protein
MSHDVPTDSELRRARDVQRVAFIATIITGLMSGIYVASAFVQPQVWQIKAAAGLAAAATGLGIMAWGTARQRYPNLAAYLLLMAPSLSIPATALFFENLTWYLFLASLVLTITLAVMTLSRQQMVQAIAIYALLAAGLSFTAEQVSPWDRFDVIQHPILQFLNPIIVGGVALMIIWQLALAYRHSDTIRARLIIAFVLLVMLPALATSGTATWTSVQSAQQLTIAQLKSVAMLKETEIERWLDSLQATLALALTEEEARFIETTDTVTYQAGYDKLAQRFNEVVAQTEDLQELLILDRYGQVLLSTDAAQEGEDFASEDFFGQGRQEPFVQPPKYDATLGHTLMVARPIFDPRQSRAVGVLAGRVRWEALEEIVGEPAGLGETSEVYLVDADRRLLTGVDLADYAPGDVISTDQGVISALQGNRSVSGAYEDYRGHPVLGTYRWLSQLRVVLVAKQDVGTLVGLGTLSQTIYLNLGVTGVLVMAAIVAALLVTRGIAIPLSNLAETAARVAAGDLEESVLVEGQGEIAGLAQAFNDTTIRLRGLVEELEQRVGRRTRVLERRTAYLEAAAEVGRAAASILDTDRLMRQVVELIRERFGLYYVGLFRVDETGEWAVLQAGTGQAGQAMLARGHRIQVGEGMIGWSIANAESRVAERAEADEVRLTIPELPETRSEAALPMRSRGRVLGALTVQSNRPEAFGVGLLTVLQTMADQVAVALDNARLFAESQEAIDAQRRAYGEISREAWGELLRTQPTRGFYRNKQGLAPITDARQWQQVASSNPEEEESTHILQVSRPITVREQVIGVINARKPPEAGQWVEEEVDLLETLVNRLEEALEGARLHEQTQSRARREQMARQITEKVRAAPDIETIAQTAAEELVRALGGARGFVQLRTETLDDNDETNGTLP